MFHLRGKFPENSQQISAIMLHMCLNGRGFLIFVYSGECLCHCSFFTDKQRQPLMLMVLKSLSLPMSKQRLDDLYGNIFSQWLTVCVGAPEALAVVRPSKMVSQRDMREVSLLPFQHSHTHTPTHHLLHMQTQTETCERETIDGRWMIKSCM